MYSLHGVQKSAIAKFRFSKIIFLTFHFLRVGGDASCDGCGKIHHGLLQLQYTQSLEQQIALLELENNYL